MKRLTALILTIACLALCLVGCANPKKSYKKLDEHISRRGVSKHGETSLKLGETAENDGALYVRYATKKNNTVTLTVNALEDEEVLYSFSLILTEGSHDTVKWEYSSYSGDEMTGTIVPKEYIKAAYKLNYLTTNIKNSARIDSTSGLCKSLCNYLLEKLKTDLHELELTAVDFGFKDYKE